MEAKADFFEAVRARQFEELRRAKEWWRGLDKAGRQGALDAWKMKNPGDFREGWSLETVSMTKGTVREVWQSTIKP